MSFSDVVITSVSNYVDEISMSFGSALPVLYRGHRESKWKLCPRLGRLEFRSDFASNLADAEHRLLDDFDRFGYPHLMLRGL